MNPSLLSSSTLVYPNDFTPVTIQTYGTEEVQYSLVQYSLVQYSRAVQYYSTVQYSTITPKKNDESCLSYRGRFEIQLPLYHCCVQE